MSTPVKAEKIDNKNIDERTDSIETPQKALRPGKTLVNPEEPIKMLVKRPGKDNKEVKRRTLPQSSQRGALQLSVGPLRSELCCVKDGIRQFVFAIHVRQTISHGELARALVTFATTNDVTNEELRHIAKVKADECSHI